jgi:tRNA nucleotidyltransferase (CCA-adding enzyme)
MIENARMLQNLLTKSGYLTLAAGGFVRDHLLGREPKDIDLATEALPEQVRDILIANNIRVEDTGLKHGTVSAIIDKIPYEITTLRVDKKCNGREADVVFIKSFEEDAKRRDFTVNAMFMDLETGKILDYVNGQEDLRKEILRFVRNPVDRITEDYLRILRLFRFASQLGFQIDPDAARYATQYLPYMTTYISTERIYTEMSKLIVGKGVFYILNTYKDLVFHVFPEMYLTVGFKQNNPYHIYDVYEHTLHGLNFLKKFNDPTLSFAHLFHDVAKPLCHTTKWNEENKCVDHFYDHEYHGAKVTQRICHRLKFSSEDTKKIYFLVANHRRLTCASSNKAMRKLIQECAEAGSKNWIWDLYKILEADKAGQAPSDFDLRLVGAHIKECLESFEKTKIESPMSGVVIKDIFKIKDGPNIGKIKDYLVAQVIEGSLDPKNAKEVWSFTLEFILVNNLS